MAKDEGGEGASAEGAKTGADAYEQRFMAGSGPVLHRERTVWRLHWLLLFAPIVFLAVSVMGFLGLGSDAPEEKGDAPEDEGDAPEEESDALEEESDVVTSIPLRRVERAVAAAAARGRAWRAHRHGRRVGHSTHSLVVPTA